MGNGLWAKNCKLKMTEECREAAAAAKADDPATLDASGPLLRFLDADGRLLGTLTRRHEVAKRLEAGEQIVNLEVAWVYEASDQYPHGLVSVRPTFGDPESPYVHWMAANIWGKPRQRRPRRAYAVNLVGGRFFADAVRYSAPGDPVTLYRETDNPHDPRAIIAKTAGGYALGYVPRDSWLQGVVHDDRCGVAATVHQADPDDGRMILSVMVEGDELGVATYDAAGREG